MTLLIADSGFDASIFADSSCAFGVFDGLHRGHRYIIERACETAGEGQRSLVLTFDRDPDEVFHADRLQKLMSNDERLEALEASGVDAVVAFPFVPEFYTLGPEDFLATMFPLGVPAHMHVGEDFRFGSRAAGTVETLQDWGRSVGCQIHPHHLVSEDAQPITSTRIRKLLAAGQFEQANRLLGQTRLRQQA